MVHELDLNLEAIRDMFAPVHEEPFILLEMPIDDADALATQLSVAIRRCYISDTTLKTRMVETSSSAREILAVKLPDRGSTMAGDFGEILVALSQAAREYPAEVSDPIKWRLKEDRTKPAPKSDVVQFLTPEWPRSSSNDRVVCSEVKTKSTPGTSNPIEAAIADSKKDSDGRLIKTLNWLKERALDTGLETVSVQLLDRFIRAVDHPPARREFNAVAVICKSLVDLELQRIELPNKDERALVVLAVPNLKSYYEKVYETAISYTADIEDVS